MRTVIANFSDVGASWCGMLATAASEMTNCPGWLTITIASLTALYTLVKIISLVLDMVRRRRETRQFRNAHFWRKHHPHETTH
jgi:hypothetical protein